MKHFEPKDFEKVLDTIEHKVSDLMEWDNIRSIGGNFNTRGLSYKSKSNPNEVGTIIVGEDDGAIAVDISLLDGAIRSFVLHNQNDPEGIRNITDWFRSSYS